MYGIDFDYLIHIGNIKAFLTFFKKKLKYDPF